VKNVTHHKHVQEALHAISSDSFNSGGIRVRSECPFLDRRNPYQDNVHRAFSHGFCLGSDGNRESAELNASVSNPLGPLFPPAEIPYQTGS
jgi:hypothetical protein